ncbi:hypothetical protein SEVIR_9G060701v4 [Setaria viridis]
MHWLSRSFFNLRKKKGGLGYRDLHLFNLAMLARQGWRLLMNPDSLCAQVLLAKYFENGKLLLCPQVLRAKYFENDKSLDMTEVPGISYSWRSIVRGIQAIKEGLIWRVGDGSQINIWLDPWVPTGVMRRPITPQEHNILRKVSELIAPLTGTGIKF